MKTIIKGMILISFLLYNLMPVNAQVTIGSGIEPAKGAILDMKEKQAADGTSTATKGVIFPRVELTSLTSLVPLLSATDAADATEKTTHKGTVVYNVTVSTTENLGEGLYYWDGEKWISVLSASASDDNAWKLTGNAVTNSTNNFIGTTDDIDFTIRTNNARRMTVNRTGDVGIGINTPTARLHLVDATKAVTDDMLRVEGLANTNYLKINNTSLLTAGTPLGRDNMGNVGTLPQSWLLGGNDNIVDADAFIGTKSNVGLKFKVGDTERMRITTGGNVGIGIANGPDIKARLHVGGEVIINQLSPTSNTNVHQVVADSDGKLKVVDAGENSAAFNYLVYKIQNPGGGGDFIDRFNTMISVKDYTLIVVGWTYTITDKNNTGSRISLVPVNINGLVNANELPGKINAFGTSIVASVYATDQIGTTTYTNWQLRADFAGGAPAHGKDIGATTEPDLEFEWTIYCMAINNAMVRRYDIQEYDMEEATTYDKAKNPFQ